MRRIITILIVFMSFYFVKAQEKVEEYDNAATKMINKKDQKLTIGAYAQIDYNQPFDSDIKQNGKLDVHRLVMLIGYKFNSKTSFITEIEYEHVKEVFVEQAFLNYKINQFIDFRGGLLLVPMGIINEFHEPPTFNGVERPNLDSKIAPTTWREIGAGFTGKFNEISLKYQFYVVNGFNGYDGAAKFNGAKGLRSGRQKGAESFMSSPNFTGKVDYYGIQGLRVGLSGYFGKSQSTLYNGIDKSDDLAMATADSSVIGISMVGVDARYNLKGLKLRGQYYFTQIKNTEEYNEFGGTDLASALTGYYFETSYNLGLGSKKELIPFIRYENYDTNYSMDGPTIANKEYNVTEVIGGIGLKLHSGAILKADMQFVKNELVNDWKKQFNFGIGIWF